MKLSLTIGDDTVSIEHVVIPVENDDGNTWGYVLNNLVWPALRAHGFILDHEFTDSIPDMHQDYLEDANVIKRGNSKYQ